MNFMRRAPAALLLLVFSLPLIAPLLVSAPDESQLPACCRRDGKHHCAMAMAGMTLRNIPSRFTVVSEKCPCCPFVHAQLMLPHVFFRTASAFTTHAASIAEVVRETEAGYRISTDRTRHKRGPPALFAS
jgi:hypothetical protein